VHRFDEARAERDVVILDDDLVVFLDQNVRNFPRDGRHRSAPAEEKIELAPGSARHGYFPLLALYKSITLTLPANTIADRAVAKQEGTGTGICIIPTTRPQL
jgi:hypothetical protein